MKILFCTNVFEVVENGPVKFANLLLQINRLYPEHEVRILTEDISTARTFVHQVPLATHWRKSPLSQLVRMWVYHREAMRLRAEFPFDVLVYNNALVGLWSAYRFTPTVGMINDDNNLTASWQWQFLFQSVKRFVFRWCEKRMARAAHTVIVNSDYLKTAVQKAYGISPEKLHRLYKAIEAPAAHSFPNQTIDPAKPIRILFVKNDFLRGGLFTLTEALGQLPYQFVLTIIGPAASDRAYIFSKFQHLSNVEGVFLGKVPQTIVAAELTKTHLFCVPSYKEALGVANLEAMAQGIPVLSTAVGGIPEVLNHGRCGWMVPPHSADALANALEECITRPDLRELKAAEALKQVERFGTKTMFEAFLTILSR